MLDGYNLAIVSPLGFDNLTIGASTHPSLRLKFVGDMVPEGIELDFLGGVFGLDALELFCKAAFRRLRSESLWLNVFVLH